MRKGIEHGPCKKHYGKNGRDATWSEPPHAQCSTLLGARRCGLKKKGGWSTTHDCCSRSGRVASAWTCLLNTAFSEPT